MIKHNSPFLRKEYIVEANKCLISNKISTGEKINLVQKFFQKNYYKLGYACLTSSGTAALYLALKGLSAHKSVKVLVPTYSCSALLNAIYLSGNEPIISDVNSEDFNLNLKKKIKNISIIIAVNIFGSDPDINKIKKVYPKAKIILDSCHSIGKKILNNDICYKVEAVIHSFYATKIVTCGHGGLVWSKNKKIINFCKDYINFDSRKKYTKRFNFLLSDFQASLLLPQIKNISKIRKFRKFIYNKYSQSLPKNTKIFSHFNHNKDIVYRCVLIFKKKIERDNFLKFMARNRVDCIIPIKKFELLHNYLSQNNKYFTKSEKICDITLSLPMHLGLKKKEILKISKLMKNYK
tara:strand:+ start:1974 stop:3023 length:1050 start_codon:yes stop_codon:yes gene_type:complete